MKKFFLFNSFFLLSILVNCQWVAQTSGTINTLYSITFSEQNTGFTVGEGGSILNTTNGGNNWLKITLSYIYTIKKITYPNDNLSSNTIFAVGGWYPYNGIVFKSTNSGSNWSYLNTNAFLWSVCFTDENNGYISGGFYPQTGYLAKTTNGGSNWSVLINNGANWFTDIYFTSSTTGYVIGGSGIILKTTNSGSSWDTQWSSTTNTLISAYFTDANTGYAVGYYGTIIKTTNGGANWNGLISGVTNFLEGIYFINPDTGYVVGEYGKILRTTNAGNTWTSQASGTSSYLRSVYFTNDSTGYVVGDGGVILKTTNSGGNFVSDNPNLDSRYQLYPCPANDQITISSIDYSCSETVIAIYNMAGTCVYEKVYYHQNSIPIDISKMVKGIYIVKIGTKKGLSCKKLIIQ